MQRLKKECSECYLTIRLGVNLGGFFFVMYTHESNK